MTTKFKPFDPATAKNGDTLYGILSGDEYKYIGKAHAVTDASVIYEVKTGSYSWVFDKHLQVAVPNRTVWVNVYDYAYCNSLAAFPYLTKEEAEKNNKKNRYFKGTFPIEIDAE